MMESTYEQHVLDRGPSCTGREFCPKVDGSVPLKCFSLVLSPREWRFYCQIPEGRL